MLYGYSPSKFDLFPGLAGATASPSDRKAAGQPPSAHRSEGSRRTLPRCPGVMDILISIFVV